MPPGVKGEEEEICPAGHHLLSPFSAQPFSTILRHVAPQGSGRCSLFVWQDEHFYKFGVCFLASEMGGCPWQGGSHPCRHPGGMAGTSSLQHRALCVQGKWDPLSIVFGESGKRNIREKISLSIKLAI